MIQINNKKGKLKLHLLATDNVNKKNSIRKRLNQLLEFCLGLNKYTSLPKRIKYVSKW